MVGEGGEQQPLAAQELVAGRYRLRRLLARGGMGEVFAAVDESTGREVALKRLLAEVRGQRGVVANFMREYHVLAELRHPRIIEVYEYGVDGEVPYYTMELLDGHDLRDLAPLPFAEACLYLRDVASSLALLHARRLLHRDVSPRNVRRTTDGRCKLIDFGAMVAFGVPPNVTGTPPCIAPEALDGAKLDQRSDLYSLGALAYYLLTGRYPYQVTQLDQLHEAWQEPLVRPRHYVHDLPDALDDLVTALLSSDPMRRPGSAAEVIDQLSALAQLPDDDTSSVAMSFLAGTRLCGRADACAKLTRQARKVLAGRGAAIVIEGAAGSGKSRMLAEASLVAQTCGLRVIRVAARHQRAGGYAVAKDLVATLRQIAPSEAASLGVDRVQWPRARVKVDVAQDVDEARGRLQQELSELFLGVARTQPLLIAVDDFERADELSASLLASLALQAHALPLLVLVTQTYTQTRDKEDSEGVRSFRSAASVLHLEPLDAAHCAELVQSMFGNVPNIERVTAWLHRTARGNPN